MPKLTRLLFVLFIHKLIDVILVLAHPSYASLLRRPRVAEALAEAQVIWLRRLKSYSGSGYSLYLSFAEGSREDVAAILCASIQFVKHIFTFKLFQQFLRDLHFLFSAWHVKFKLLFCIIDQEIKVMIPFMHMQKLLQYMDPIFLKIINI